MKTRVVFAIVVMIGVAFAVSYQGDRAINTETSNYTTNAQSVICEDFSTETDTCGDSQTCGSGFFDITGQFSDGPGIEGTDLMNAECHGSNCPAVENVPTAFNNPNCCDQDRDGYNRTSCGVTSIIMVFPSLMNFLDCRGLAFWK